MLGREGLLVQSATEVQTMLIISKCLKSENSGRPRKGVFALAVLISTAWTPAILHQLFEDGKPEP